MVAPHGFCLVLLVEAMTDFWLDFLVEQAVLPAPHFEEGLPIMPRKKLA